MGRRLDIASGKNEFDRQLGNFRVQIQRDHEGEPVATITANILGSPTPFGTRTVQRHYSTVDISTPAPEALRLAVYLTGGEAGGIAVAV
jgi:hypothetical protein